MPEHSHQGGGTREKRFFNLSRPHSEMKPEYDMIVIGSGYGGGVSALRGSLMRNKTTGERLKVCMLERGREFLPGDFPDELLSSLKELQLTVQAGDKAIHTGSKTGLFDVRQYDTMSLVLGCGLGGTSLINANVALPADKRVYQTDEWPEILRNEFASGDFDKHFDTARKMLGSNVYPNKGAHPKLSKAEALREAVENVKESGVGDMAAAEWYMTPINVTFKETTHETSGLTQPACNNCGDCVTGCNVGAKNTTAMNYLPSAWAQGVEIYCETEVLRVSRSKDGKWLVHYRFNGYEGKGRALFCQSEMWVRAERVVISAGTMGTNEIMLRSKKEGLQVSDRLGHHYSGNGDSIGAAAWTKRKVQNFGAGHNAVDSQFASGPCITSICDMRDIEDLDLGYIVEDCAIPGALRSVSGLALPFDVIANSIKDFGEHPTLKGIEKIVKDIKQGDESTLDNLEAFLVMSQDRCSTDNVNSETRGWGTISLSSCGKTAMISWPEVGKLPNWKHADDGMKDLADALKAEEYISNPLWENGMAVSVHSLGGCVIAETCDEGVVNHKGQVFTGDNPASTEVYKGLYIMDGSIVPRCCGINPLLTITGLSERAMGYMLEDDANLEPVPSQKPVRPYPKPVMKPSDGVRFTEEMDGKVTRISNGEEFKCNFVLLVTLPDLPALEMDAGFAGNFVEGTVTCTALSPDRLMVSDGRFQLFAQDPDVVDGRRMVYQFKMTASDGGVYYFDGFKRVKIDYKGPLELWTDTTHLTVSITAGDTCPWSDNAAVREKAKKSIAYRGLLTIGLFNFSKQMTTMDVISKHDDANTGGLVGTATCLATHTGVLVRFAKMFERNLADIYMLRNTVNPQTPALSSDLNSPSPTRDLRCKVTSVHYPKCRDGVELKLTRYCNGLKGPVVLMHGLGVSSGIFLPLTIETNLVEYLYERGYDVWLPEMRVSSALPELSCLPCNLDTLAKDDWPTHINEICRLAQVRTVQVYAHCLGALTFSMALLNGIEGVRSVCLSQVGWYTDTPFINWAKSTLRLPSVLNLFGVKGMDPTDNDCWYERLAMRAQAYVQERPKQWCSEPTCHEITFMYGNLHQHDNLNDATHRELRSMFGFANMDTLLHSALTVRKGHVVDVKGKDTYMPGLDDFVRRKIPVHVVHGMQNKLWSPKGSERLIDELRTKSGRNGLDKDIYTRTTFQHYGHLDCVYGKTVFDDVYPSILCHLEKYCFEDPPSPAG